MNPDVLMHSLRIQVDPADSTYMPSVIVVSGGEMLSSMKEIVSVNISPTDRIVSLLSNLKEYLRYIEIGKLQFCLHFWTLCSPIPTITHLY